jgi:hypothetical protein
MKTKKFFLCLSKLSYSVTLFLCRGDKNLRHKTNEKMTNFNETIERNTEKIKARHMVDGLEANYERFHKGKEKAFAGLPARGFKLERKIAERAKQENMKIFCYESDSNVYWDNIQTPKTSNFLDKHSDVLSYQNIDMPPNGIADFNEYVLPMFLWRDYCGTANHKRISESTQQCAKGSVLVVTFYASCGRGAHDLPWEICDRRGKGHYGRNLEPYLEREFAEKGWMCIWSHPYATNPVSKMLMMAFTNCDKAYQFLTKND